MIYAKGEEGVSVWETTWLNDADDDDCDDAAHDDDDDDRTTNIGGPSHHEQSSFVSSLIHSSLFLLYAVALMHGGQSLVP